MKVRKLGEGEPEYTVVGSIHGDEPAGKRAIERFLEEDWDVDKPVQFVIGNPKALVRDVRYIDTDLNRAFPGDEDSELYEDQLAAKIYEKVEGTTLLDIHTTHSSPEIFVNTGSLDERNVEMAKNAGAKYVVWYPDSASSLTSCVGGVNVECGYQHSDAAAKNAYKVIVNFLAAEGVIEAEFERSEPQFFRHTGDVSGGDWLFLAENFQKVEEGEVFARRDGERLEAEEDFYPVLMSSYGYEHMLGNKAVKMSMEEVKSQQSEN
ncbi:MAG: succinylglutamate desuccinylase/aspartoacylase family protein [Candidatus Nanohaloarchaea archaeon]